MTGSPIAAPAQPPSTPAPPPPTETPTPTIASAPQPIPAAGPQPQPHALPPPPPPLPASTAPAHAAESDAHGRGKGAASAPPLVVPPGPTPNAVAVPLPSSGSSSASTVSPHSRRTSLTPAPTSAPAPAPASGSAPAPTSPRLPPQRQRQLQVLFQEIERELAHLYEENIQLRQRLNVLEGRPANAGLPSYPAGSAAAAALAQLPLLAAADGPDADGVSTASGRSKATGRRANKAVYRAQWQRVSEYFGHRDGVVDVNVCPWNRHCFATASLDRSARVWALNTPTFMYSYYGHKGAVNSVRFHPNEPIVCTGSGDRTAHLWRLPSLTLRAVDQAVKGGGHSGPPRRISLDEVSLADSSSSIAESAISLETTSLTGRTALLKLTHHTDVVTAAEWLPDGHRIATSSWDRSTVLWDVGEGTAQLTQLDQGHEQRVNNVVAHRSQPLLLSAARDGTFRLWDIRRAGKHAVAVPAHSGSVRTAAFASVGTLVVSAGEDGQVKVWDQKNLKMPTAVVRLRAGVNRRRGRLLFRLAVSPTTATVAAPCDNGDVVLFDLGGSIVGSMIRSATAHTKTVVATAWTADEAHLLSAGYPEDIFGWAPVKPAAAMP